MKWIVRNSGFGSFSANRAKGENTVVQRDAATGKLGAVRAGPVFKTLVMPDGRKIRTMREDAFAAALKPKAEVAS